MTRRHLFTTAAGAAIATACPASVAPTAPVVLAAAVESEAWVFSGIAVELGDAGGYKGHRCMTREEIIKHFGWEKGIPAGYAIGEPAI